MGAVGMLRGNLLAMRFQGLKAVAVHPVTRGVMQCIAHQIFGAIDALIGFPKGVIEIEGDGTNDHDFLARALGCA